MWRVVVLLLILGLSGCSEPVPLPFNNVDITGGEFGRSLIGLKDHHGQPKTLSDFRGKAVLIFFGYTSCPDICPTSLARFAEVMKQLGRD
ncbi:MAG: SCO family protein, partial [Betaproteobacteria bacterium]